jgi:hypothetical protein
MIDTITTAELKRRISRNGAQFVKKPIVVRAFQTAKEIMISTLEGDMKANVGDWIIEGVNGEFYPCKPEIFAKTYKKYKGGKSCVRQ